MNLSLRKMLGRLTGFNYDAVVERGRRRPPGILLRSEDAELPPLQRSTMLTGVRDAVRNFSIAAWAVRRHLDYVTSFSFQGKTGNAKLDTFLENLVCNIWSKPENFDIAGRHSLQAFARLAEARRTCDGDMGVIKLASGLVQPMEGDRIRTPGDISQLGLPDPQVIVHGVQVDKYGKAKAYSICNRGVQAITALGGSNTFVFEKMVSAANLYLHAHYERFDQIRGVSPLASAYNTYRDLYEGFDFALAKIKISQLFGLAITRDSAEPMGDLAAEEDEEGAPDGRYQIDFGKSPIVLDMDPGDTAQFLSCATPATDTQQFFETMIGVALKSLDLPFSFYNESFTNYSGSRGAWIQYEQSADLKRKAVRDLLDHLTKWRLLLYLLDGEFAEEFPGLTIDDLKWQWVHRGVPWLDPLKEVQAEVQSVDALLDNSEDIAQRHGKNFFDNVDKQAACIAYAKLKGVPWMAGAIVHAPAAVAPEEPPAKPKSKQKEPPQ